MRINRYLSMAGVCSRREADRLIEEGRVTINDRVAKLGDNVEEDAEVRVKGKLVDHPETKDVVILKYHKPAGVVCTSSRVEKHNIIDEISYAKRVFPVGRLDKDTEGLLLLTNFYPRLAFWGSLAMLAGFSLFLTVLAVKGNHDNCNCFGELVNLNPVQSLLKNLGMLVLLLLSAGIRPFRFRHKGLWLALIILIPLATVFIVSPPDNWRYDSYARHELVNEPAFREAVDQGILPHSVVDGDHIVCFYSLKCRFCKMSAEKIMTLRARDEFPQCPIIAVIGRGEDTDTTPFLEETGFAPDEIHFIEPADFLRITNGSFPVILVMHGDTIAETFNYRNLH